MYVNPADLNHGWESDKKAKEPQEALGQNLKTNCCVPTQFLTESNESSHLFYLHKHNKGPRMVWDCEMNGSNSNSEQLLVQ